jgi:hypothetical protein
MRKTAYGMSASIKQKCRPDTAAFRSSMIIVKRQTVLRRPGSDLLSQVLRLSTISAEEFNGRVRDGIGFRLLAKTTRPAKDSEAKLAAGF